VASACRWRVWRCEGCGNLLDFLEGLLFSYRYSRSAVYRAKCSGPNSNSAKVQIGANRCKQKGYLVSRRPSEEGRGYAKNKETSQEENEVLRLR
jgi:hypothetical protein